MKKQLSALAAVFLCLFLLASCGTQKSGADVFEKPEKAAVVSAAGKNKALGVSSSPLKKLKAIAQKGLTTLYLDESSLCVCVFDGTVNRLWRALPESTSNENACMLSVNVLSGADEYVLDSQNDSVALKNAQYKTENGVLTISYRFQKQLNENAQADFTVPVRFELSDGSLKVFVDCKSIAYKEKNKNVKLKSLSLLSFFGADADGEKGDFILVPDGCGAVIDTKARAEKFTPVSIPVYGADPAARESSQSLACIPAFGKKSGNAAFLALIESSEAIAKIKAEKALKKGGLNRVFASFELCKTYTDEKKTYVSQNSFDGTIALNYRFLSGESTDYVSMAGVCRELLIRSGALRMDEKSASQGSELPFELTLIGSARLEKEGASRPGQTALTSLSEATDIISFLRSKGIKSTVLRYRGLFNGGLVQNGFSGVKLFSSVATGRELEAFSALNQSQNIPVFAQTELFTAAGERECAASIDGKRAEKKEQLLSGTFARSNSVLNFSPAEKAEKNSERLLSSLRSFPFDGVCVSDAGRLLYSDFSKSIGAGRSEMQSLFSSRCAALSSSKKLMVSGANLYAIKYASFLTDIPSAASCAKQKGCTSVPFLQAVLHGIVDYSHTAFNKEKNSETAFLKAAEYGAVPSYEWYSADLGSEEEKDELYYMNGASEAQRFYERMNAVFSGLQVKKITAHKKVAGGVYCTEYGSSDRVYVNYNKKDVTVNGVTVEARSFLKVSF